MKLPANVASTSVEELWEIYEELVELLEAKIVAEKEMIERQSERVPRFIEMRFGLARQQPQPSDYRRKRRHDLGSLFNMASSPSLSTAPQG